MSALTVTLTLEEAADALQEYAARKYNAATEEVEAVAVVSYGKVRCGWAPHEATGGRVFFSLGEFRHVAEGAPLRK